MNSHKLEPRIMQRLTALAATMPEPAQQCTRKLTGKQLIDMGFTAWEGEEVVLDRIYEVPVRVQTNIVRHLTRLYRKKGMDAVNTFVARALSNATEEVFS